MDSDKAAKILLLGKTGTGKSAFINYFIGKKVAEEGKGKPVTQGYCIEYRYNDGKYPIIIFDNKGFEAKTADEQKQHIIRSVKEHNNSDDVFNWFHTIFYCVSMSNSRFEDFEASFINDLSRSISQNVHIILTKCDDATPEKIQNMKSTIMQKLNNSNFKIYEVVSVSMRKRNGDIVEPYGKEVLSASVFRLLWEDIASRISLRYAAELHDKLISVTHKSCNTLNKCVQKMCSLSNFISMINEDGEVDDNVDKIYKKYEREQSDIIEQTNKKFNEILQPVADLYISYTNTVVDSFSDTTQLNFNEWFELENYMDNIDERMAKHFPCGSSDLDNFWKVLGAIGEIITVKIRLSNMIHDIEKEAIAGIPSEDDIARKAKAKLMSFLDHFCF